MLNTRRVISALVWWKYTFIANHHILDRNKPMGATNGAEFPYHSWIYPHFFPVRFMLFNRLFAVESFVDHCGLCWPVSFGHCIFCPSSIYPSNYSIGILKLFLCVSGMLDSLSWSFTHIISFFIKYWHLRGCDCMIAIYAISAYYH